MTTAAIGGAGSQFGALLRTMRLKQWTKNLFVLSPLLFSQHFFEPSTMLAAVEGFVLFSLIASCVYILNDIIDRRKDRLHPVKMLRPIASGVLPVTTAAVALGVLLVFTITASFAVGTLFAATIIAYFAWNVIYSLFLKEAVIIDVMAIAMSFILRIVAGAFAIDVPLSEWLLICTSLLALFLGFSKRRHELTLLEDNAQGHRRVLLEYSPYFLDQMISLVTASTLICYILYTLDGDTIAKFGSKNLLFTVPFVLYGLFRYLYLVHQRKTGGDPTAELLTDKPLLVNVFLWGLTVILVIYFR